MFQESAVSRSVATAKADQGDAYKRLPVRGEKKMMAGVAFKGPNLGKVRVFAPQIQAFRTTNAVLRRNAVPRPVAKITLRWLSIPRRGCCGAFGIATTESTIRGAPPAPTDLDETLGF